MWISSSLYRFFIASSKFIIHQEDFQHFSWSLIRGLGQNPGDLATIYQSLKKTDKEDSLKIARLIR
ncbi:hypothetical protein LEP1GSC039_2540 [Leptospira santarosai str. 2000027870]|nr:hypothetical protein LEP1GSC039_2540 [Leptospira santarosai str. 2000027870]